MKLLELKELQMVFDVGGLQQAIISEWAIANAYNVTFKGKDGEYGFKGQRQKNALREFKSIDAAMSSIRKVGFKKALIVFQ